MPVSSQMSQEHHYIYVPIGQTKKNEYCQYEYMTRDELCDHIKTLEARALTFKLAHVPIETYTLPISNFQWNVLLAFNDKVKSAWITAQKRAITGNGTIVAKDYDMLRENVGYRLSVNEAAAASHRANTPAGWTSKTSKNPKTGKDRSPQHGRLYNLSRPIHTVHTKSIFTLEEIRFATNMASRYARSFRSPSVESDSDVSMRTASPPASPPPEDTQDDRFADADDTTATISSASRAEATNIVEDAQTPNSEDHTLTNHRNIKVRFALPEKHDIEGTESSDTPAFKKAKQAKPEVKGSEAPVTPAKLDHHIVEPSSAKDAKIEEAVKPEANGSEASVIPAKLDDPIVEPKTKEVVCDVDPSSVPSNTAEETKVVPVPTSAMSGAATEAPSHGVPAASSFKVLNITQDLLVEVPEGNFPTRVIPNRRKQQRLEVNQFLHNLFKSKAVSGPRRS